MTLDRLSQLSLNQHQGSQRFSDHIIKYPQLILYESRARDGTTTKRRSDVFGNRLQLEYDALDVCDNQTRLLPLSLGFDASKSQQSRFFISATPRRSGTHTDSSTRTQITYEPAMTNRNIHGTLPSTYWAGNHVDPVRRPTLPHKASLKILREAHTPTPAHHIVHSAKSKAKFIFTAGT